MSIKLRTASPSRLKALSACPRWVPDYDEKDEAMKAAAEEGTRLHGLCERIVMSFPVEEWDDKARLLSGSDYDLVAEALAPVRDVVVGCHLKPFHGTSPSIPVGTYRAEVALESALTGKQRIDVLLRTELNAATVVDFKFVRSEPDVRLQMESYALTVFDRHAEIEVVQLLAPAPRVFADNYSSVVTRKGDSGRIRKEVTSILERMSDPFHVGKPGQHCCTCFGNGRCPWQAAALKDVACDPEAAVVSKADLLDPATPEGRGKRKELTQWLKKYCEACDEQDKAWALANPGTALPGWKVSMSAGRKSLDPERRLEAARIAEAVLEIYGDDLLSCATLDPKALALRVQVRDNLSEDAAKEKVADALDCVMRRGNPFPTMRRCVERKELTA